MRIILPAIIAVVVLCAAFFGIKALVSRLIPDKTPPVIELTRKQNYYASSADKYEEEGFTATDNRDGDLTDSVSRSVDGDTVRYEVSDRAGNITVEYRDIPVREGGSESDSDDDEMVTYTTDRENIDPGYVPDEKVIYLTFDDGPSEYTEKLLQILDRYNVHATFFVTGAFPDYAYMIQKEYEKGHSIGVHTYSHDFSEIYSDTKAFWKDFEKMEDVIEQQTGHRTSLMRFAGGSSNTMSAQYSQGIMEELTKEAEKKGYHYFDWNVSSGDGGSDCTGQEVVNNVIRQVRENDQSVVLCHDTKEYTVNNIEYVIAWALENGYTFLPLNETSAEVHHGVMN